MTWLRSGLFFGALLLWKVAVAGAQGLGTTGATLVGYLWVAGVMDHYMGPWLMKSMTHFQVPSRCLRQTVR